MLTPLHPTAPRRAEADLVDLLLACHRRIRAFLVTAHHLADAEAVTDSEAREAAQAIARYFAEALPLHVRDEDESIVPRLRGRSAAVDTAIREMSAEHRAHEAPVAHLVTLCRRIAEAPADRPTLRAELAACVAELEGAFAEHLSREESVIFPAIHKFMDATRQAAIVTELRARRATH